MWTIVWCVTVLFNGHDGKEPTDRLIPANWQGNPWGPEATRARSSGEIAPIPMSPLMLQWDKWGKQVLRDGDIVFRTEPAGSSATATGTTVGFEVDHIDEATSEGWSVVLTGHAALVDNQSELEQFATLGIEPWAGSAGRDAVIRIKTAGISGRNIRQQG